MGKILLVLAMVAAMTYALFWLIEQRRAGRGGSGGRGRGGGGGGSPRPQRPGPGGANRVTGPDDDPAFLREIERRRREAQRQAESRRPDGDGPAGPSQQPPPEPV